MSNLVACKSCGHEVSKSAKVCPNCGHKLKWGLGKRVLVAFVVFIGIGTLAGMLDENKETAEGQGVLGEAKAVQSSVRIGDIVETKNYEISVGKVQLLNSVGNEYFSSKPADGGVYVGIQWAYKNISDKPIGSFSTPSIRLVDPKGTAYSPDMGASVYYATMLDLNAKSMSNLNPGIGVRDADVFEVSREMFDPSTWNILVDADKKITVNFKEK